MSLAAHFADEGGHTNRAGAVASGGECTAFGRWVDRLPARGHEVLKQLREGGFALDLAALEEQLRRALAGGQPDPDAARVGRRLLDVLGRRGGACCLLVGEEPAQPTGVEAGH